MLNGIRIALACAVLLVSTASSQDAKPQWEIPVENTYVRVSVVPPMTVPPISINDCINGPEQRFVRLYVPTRAIHPTADAPRRPGSDDVSALYFGPDVLWGCNGSWNGTSVYVDLKLIPTMSAFHDDGVKLDPTHYEVLLENDRVRVVRVRFAAGEAGPIVDKRPRVILAVTDSHATVTFPDGHSEPRDMKAGTVSFGNAGRQATKNTGTTPLENIVVELKSKDSEKK